MAVVAELSSTPQEGQEVIVVQSPHAVTSCRLEPVRRLNVAHDLNVAPKDTQDNRWAILGQLQDAKLAQAESGSVEIDL